jgi:uncharacterized membrane protein YhaH (DUF805 family)
MNLSFLLFSLDGRIGRARFWLGTLILAGVSLVATYVILARAGLSHAAVMFSAAMAFALAYPSYAVMAKRFQDRDRPGWLALIGLVPVYVNNLLYTFGVFEPTEPTLISQGIDAVIVLICLWYLVELGLLKGTQGPNPYGLDPLGRAQADANLG